MLSEAERGFLDHRRVAHLATADARAVPHVVPVCFAIAKDTLYITIDDKPKQPSGLALKRLRNITENPAVAVVVDHYNEDWTELSPMGESITMRRRCSVRAIRSLRRCGSRTAR
jgi:PPOX class probable F420-dependent enzyme